jgi:hypothetical protein
MPIGERTWLRARRRAAVGGMAALALACMAVTGVAQAAYLGQEGRIAFVRGQNIFSIEPGGTGLSQLTSDGRDSGPRWSPDGQDIAYLDHGNLWIMHANGSHKRRITRAAPGHFDSRPTWSPNGRYLAFVKTARGKKSGYLTRYDTVTHDLVTFSIPDNSEQPTIAQVKVTALPAAVAWTQARNAASKPAFFLLFEGTGHPFCMAHFYCLDALGLSHQYQHKNGFPSAADQTHTPTRLLDPDWFPVDPAFGSDALTTVQTCASAHCAHTGIDLQIGQSAILPGAYQAVYSPTGRHFAFVRNVRGRPQIYLTNNDPAGAAGAARLLTAGSQPDWQPRALAPPA